MVDAGSGLSYRFQTPRPNESASETAARVKRNRCSLNYELRVAGWGVDKGNTVTNLNPHHLHHEVVVDGVLCAEAYWAKDWAGRHPSPVEKNVLYNTNRHKRATVADPNAAERGALKLTNVQRLEQHRLRPNFLHQVVPNSDTALAAALLSCADDADTLDEK